MEEDKEKYTVQSIQKVYYLYTKCALLKFVYKKYIFLAGMSDLVFCILFVYFTVYTFCILCGLFTLSKLCLLKVYF